MSLHVGASPTPPESDFPEYHAAHVAFSTTRKPAHNHHPEAYSRSHALSSPCVLCKLGSSQGKNIAANPFDPYLPNLEYSGLVIEDLDAYPIQSTYRIETM
ncbi:hypothetical protein BPOR_0152g00120 [Botrytis porri]|uniref:Uncharacterized protein n=1 Tax=Botrytis porri TaxID=87229 RepID=A0A4Z1KW21_9HELO|nr:hypothetical protein BPOR_0152g00120 [Botrytis porri]